MKKLLILAAGAAAGTIAWAPVAHAESPTYTVSVGSASVTEGDSAAAVVSLTLNQAAPAGGLCFAVTIGAPSDSATAGEDYVAQADQVVSIAEGSTTGTVSVPIVDDLEPELDKVFTVSVAPTACGGSHAPAPAVTVTNDGTVNLADNDALPDTGVSVGYGWAGLGLLGAGVTALMASRRRGRLA